MLAERYNLRKIIIWFLAVVLVFFAALKVYDYLTSGKVVITTSNKNNYIKIQQVVSGGGKPLENQAQGRLSVRVKPGKYNVIVYSQSVEHGTSQTVTVRARQTVKLSLDPPSNLAASPVFGSGTTGVVASSTDLYYIDTTTNLLMYDGGAGLNSMFPDYSLTAASWFSPGYGVVQDATNKLYMVSNGSITPLSLPFETSPNKSVAFSVSSDGYIYVSDGQGVFVGRPGDAFTKIYSVKGDSVGLSAGVGRVAVVVTNAGSSVGSLVIVNNSGKSTSKGVSASQATWATDGARLLVSGEGTNYIYDAALNRIGSVPANNIGVSAWQNNHQLFYAMGSQIWSYDLNTKKAWQVTSMPTGVGITSLYLDTTNSYLYFSAAVTSKNQLFRVGLSGQKQDDSLQTLSVVLPDNVGVCSLNYIVFSQPTILINYPALETSADLCIRSAKGSLTYYGLDPNRFSYVTSTITPAKQ